MENTPTPHISCKFGEIAKTVLLPGDPLRAKMIAEKFLADATLVNSVRNNFCYTGTYKGKKISVMSTGMGCASMGIYSYELFNFYGVENAIRIGTIGALNDNYKIKDIILAKKTISNTNYLNFFKENGEGEISASNELLSKAKEVAQETNTSIKECSIYTTDTFYSSQNEVDHQISLNVAGVEMECASLYLNALNSNKKALTICTVSDELYSGKKTTSEERQNNFLGMVKLALDLAVSL